MNAGGNALLNTGLVMAAHMVNPAPNDQPCFSIPLPYALWLMQEGMCLGLAMAHCIVAPSRLAASARTSQDAPCRLHDVSLALKPLYVAQA